MSINLLTITDPHFSGTSPRAYIGSYKNNCLAILAECAELAQQHQCHAVLIPGDLTNSHIMSTPVLREFVEALKKFPCPVLTVAGNHDRETTNLEDLKESPYGLLRAAGVIQDVHEKPFVSLNYSFAVTGYPYDENTDIDIDQYSQYVIPKKLGRVTIHLTHGMLLPEPPWWAKDNHESKMRFTTFEQMAQLPLPDIICNGHYHGGHEATYLSSHGNVALIVNYGAVCRLSRSLEEIKRVLRVGLITIEEPGRYKAEPIILKSQRPGHECLDREELVRELERQKNKEKMTEYLNLLGTKREIRTRDAREVIKLSVKELAGVGGEKSKFPPGVAAEVVEGRCLARLDRVSQGMEAKEAGEVVGKNG
jgi:DNA repair exonuclease SbcCD nuclease subunit